VSTWFTVQVIRRRRNGELRKSNRYNEELLVSSLASNDALAKLLIEKGIITEQEFLQKLSEERATYQRMLNPTAQ
jgi:hypothetical protein